MEVRRLSCNKNPFVTNNKLRMMLNSRNILWMKPVISVEEEVFHSIKNNTNDEGSAEGYEVCQRIRDNPGKDFISI